MRPHQKPLFFIQPKKNKKKGVTTLWIVEDCEGKWIKKRFYYQFGYYNC